MDPSRSSPTIYEIGNHVIRVEGGVLLVLFKGRVSTKDAVLFQEHVLSAGDRFGVLAALVELDGLVDFDTGARAQFARVERQYPFYAVAFYGGTFASRVLVTTILRAGKLIAPARFPFAFDVFPTAPEARAFVEAARPKTTSPPP